MHNCKPSAIQRLQTVSILEQLHGEIVHKALRRKKSVKDTQTKKLNSFGAPTVGKISASSNLAW